MNTTAAARPSVRVTYTSEDGRLHLVQASGRVFRVMTQAIKGVWTVQELDSSGDPLVIRRPRAGLDPADDLNWVLGFGAVAFSFDQALEEIRQNI